MAIFGNFSELPPCEVISLVGRRSGLLAIRQPGHAVELSLAEGYLDAFSENGLPVLDVLTLSDRFRRLLESRTGDFRLEPGVARGLSGLHVPVDQLITSTLRDVGDREAAQASLPSAHTIMLTTGKPEPHLPEELRMFWERSEPHLQLGASALQLAGCTGISALQARWLLYRLRLAGLVRNRRSGEKTQSGSRLSESEVPAPLAASAPESEDLRKVQLGSAAPSVLRRLLNSFSGLFH